MQVGAARTFDLTNALESFQVKYIERSSSFASAFGHVMQFDDISQSNPLHSAQIFSTRAFSLLNSQRVVPVQIIIHMPTRLTLTSPSLPPACD